MVDLTKYQNGRASVVDAIYEAYEEREYLTKPRGYLGASAIGDPCSRRLWYGFRWCGKEKFKGRMLRLFDRGNIEEVRMISDLRAIGCEVHEIDENTKKQFEVSFAWGHGRGHMDGVGRGIPEAPVAWHVLEFKTHSAKHFARLIRDKVQIAFPKHFSQVQIEMHLTGMERALYLACNKDTDELYSERVPIDKAVGASLVTKAERIISSARTPSKIGSGPEDEECRFCNFSGLCYGNPAGPAVPCNVNCRTCCFSAPVCSGDSGAWECKLGPRGLSLNDQKAACPRHLFIPDLIGFAEIYDMKDGDSITYLNRDTEAGVWVQGSGPGEFTSKELTMVPYSVMSEIRTDYTSVIVDLKKSFHAKIVGVKMEEAKV